MKFKTKYKLPLALAALFTALCFVGCETTAGVGRDLEAAGDGIEDAAESNQPY